MSAPLAFLVVVLVIAATPFLITYVTFRATEAENSQRRAPVGSLPKNANFPVAIRLVFLVIGVLLLILSAKVGYALVADCASAYEVFQLMVLALCSLFALSFALPPQHFTTIALALTLTFTVLTMSTYLWRFGGYWRWCIVVLVVVLPFLIVKAIRKSRSAKDSSNNAEGFDSMSSDSCGVGDGGGCSGGGD